MTTINYIQSSVLNWVSPVAWNFTLSSNDYDIFNNIFFNVPGGVWGMEVSLQTISGSNIVLANNQWSLIPNTNFFQITNAPALGISISDVATISYKTIDIGGDDGGEESGITPGTIISQPGDTSRLRIAAAYRPVVFDVEFLGNPPVTYCDIYFNGVYYKTLSKTFPERQKIYRFDIADACQEFLSSELAPINSGGMNIPKNHFLECFCKFRSSKIDTNGFIKQEEKVPVQETNSTPSVSGDGIQSLSFYVLNTTLQHENNQILKKHLEHIERNLVYPQSIASQNTLPLTHRPMNYKVCVNDSDYFPFVSCFMPKKIVLQLKYKNGTVVDHIGLLSLPYQEYTGNNPIGCEII